MNKPEIKIGDTIWTASYGNERVQVPCPTCYGKKEVVVILGNGDHVAISCDYCSQGYEPPRGYVHEYVEKGSVSIHVVTEIRSYITATGESLEYRAGDRMVDGDKAYRTEDEAQAMAAELAAKHKHKEETRAEYLKKNPRRSYAFNAGYHLREAKDHRKKAEYHDWKAKLCKAKAKAGGDDE